MASRKEKGKVKALISSSFNKSHYIHQKPRKERVI